MNIDTMYQCMYGEVSDIRDHMPMLKHLSSLSDTVVEFGVRKGYSTIALLAGRPAYMASYDINPFEDYEKVKDIITDTEFRFIQKSDLTIQIQPCDLLFIDTVHTYEQLHAELELHGNKAKSWIVMHDTHLFGQNGEDLLEGIWKAVTDFLDLNKCWNILFKTDICNGLTVLEKV